MHYWTVDEVLALPEDGNRYEVIDGELLVSPSPRLLHQDAIPELWLRLRDYLREYPSGHALASPADIQLEVETLVQPDVFVAPLLDGKRPKGWTEIRSLLLAVEVISPSTGRADRQVKRLFYQRAGVREYWIVDVDARLIERWRPSDTRPEVLTESIEWQPDASHPPLAIDLESYFADVTGEPLA